MAKEMNSDGQAGSSRIDQGPEASGNAKVGIDARYAAGTVSNGFDKAVDYPRATSASSSDHAKNAGNPDNKPSTNDSAGVSDKFGAKGTVGSRENMTYGGGENKGHIYGKGAGSNPDVRAEDVLLGGVKTFNREKTMQGTGGETAQYKKSMRGYKGRLSE